MRALGVLGLLALAACGGPPIDPALISQPDELRVGSGLLTGPSGIFTRSF